MKNLKKVLAGLILAGISLMIMSCGNNNTMLLRTYKVTYSLGEGVEGTAPKDTKDYLPGQSATIAAAPERRGYTFTVWNDGKADYGAGASYKIENEDVTFTARWKKIEETKSATAVAENTQQTQQTPQTPQSKETVKNPIFSVAGGTVEKDTVVIINCATSGADIYYTLDGSTPGASSTKYAAALTITDSVVVKAIGIKEGMNNSDVVTVSYAVKGTVATPTFSVADSVIDSGTTVEINCTTQGAQIHYTTDNSVPTTASPLYAGAITITTGTTIKAIAVKNGMYDSAVAVKSYTIQGSVETPVFSVTDGAVDYGTQVTITSGTEGAAIYYTTDGSVPTNASTPYAGAITVTAGMTIKAIAVKAGLTDSATGSVTYTIKTYTMTYATSRGTAPIDATAYHKGQVVTVQNMAGITGWTFKHWTDGSNNYAAGGTITVATSNIVLTAVWTEWEKVATPAFSVAAGAIASGTTVTITCSTAGATIYYTTDGSTPTSSSTAYSTPVTIDEAMTLKAIAVKSGMYNSAVASADYTINSSQSTGLLEGAGTVEKVNIEISGTSYQKTGEVVVIPAGKQAVIDMKDDSSWNTYSVDYAYYIGVFIKDRKVTLSPFVMGQYEVTQELYKAVMGSNPSGFYGRGGREAASGETQNLRPVENVKHYEAVAFCNELTKKTMTANDVVYFSDAAKTIAYTKADATAENTPYMDITKKGYRLPTEAEWEYAARGGNPKSADWKNAFGKVTSANNATINDGGNLLFTDNNLATVGWYKNNSGNKTHEVGLKEKNSLNLYDMQGNVWEWCWDWSGDIATGNATDPVGASGDSKRVCRGGSFLYDAYFCTVSYRHGCTPNYQDFFLGFRLCRSAQ